MKRADYIKLSRSQAQKMLTPEDYETLKEAINAKKEVYFQYTDDQGGTYLYKAVLPIEFFLTPEFYEGIKRIEDKLNPIPNEEKTLEEKIKGTVYLWSYHRLHKRKHSFYAETTTGVNFWPTIIDALTQPQKYYYFWTGSTNSIETEEI